MLEYSSHLMQPTTRTCTDNSGLNPHNLPHTATRPLTQTTVAHSRRMLRSEMCAGSGLLGRSGHSRTGQPRLGHASVPELQWQRASCPRRRETRTRASPTASEGSSGTAP